jgi:predicted Zn finger-like uncharacterized protein
MIIKCESCSRKFIVEDSDIPKEGRTVQCGYCSVTWHQVPVSISTKTIKKLKIAKSVPETDESPSVDSIEASDGKTYRFLGSQWAELLSSGKTGLFARKKISQELDEITGRKEIKTTRKRKKKLDEVDPSSESLDDPSSESLDDPSSESLDNEKQILDINKRKQGLGLFGYIFLLIIIGFSVVGVLRTLSRNRIYLSIIRRTTRIFS